MSEIAPRDQGPLSLISQAVGALPLPAEPDAGRWNLRSATAAWLASRRSDATRKAYWRDLGVWLTWCDETGVDPRAAKRADVDAFVVARCAGLARSSTNRRLSAISSWYAYLVSNDVAARNPVEAVDRPPVDRDYSPTVGLAKAEAAEFMRAARRATGGAARRNAALLGMMIELGLRVGEALRLDVDSLGHNRGHRTVRIRGKGGKMRELPVPPPLGRDLDAWLTERGDWPGPLFATTSRRRMDQPEAFRVVRRTAKRAGLDSWERISNHSLRHSLATLALSAGAPLSDVQDVLGHADPRTTRRYDRDRHNLDRSAVYRVAGVFAHDDDGESSDARPADGNAPTRGNDGQVRQ